MSHLRNLIRELGSNPKKVAELISNLTPEATNFARSMAQLSTRGIDGFCREDNLKQLRAIVDTVVGCREDFFEKPDENNRVYQFLKSFIERFGRRAIRNLDQDFEHCYESSLLDRVHLRWRLIDEIYAFRNGNTNLYDYARNLDRAKNLPKGTGILVDQTLKQSVKSASEIVFWPAASEDVEELSSVKRYLNTHLIEPCNSFSEDQKAILKRATILSEVLLTSGYSEYFDGEHSSLLWACRAMTCEWALREGENFAKMIGEFWKRR